MNTLALGKLLDNRRMPSEVVVAAVGVRDSHAFSEALTPGVEAATETALAEVSRLVLRELDDSSMA